MTSSYGVALLIIKSSRPADDRQSGRPPLWKAVLQSAHLETAYAKLCDRFVGQHAIGTATVGDDLLLRINLTEAGFKFA